MFLVLLFFFRGGGGGREKIEEIYYPFILLITPRLSKKSSVINSFGRLGEDKRLQIMRLFQKKTIQSFMS